MKKLLVLTALTSPSGFPIEVYNRFAGSLASTGFAGDIVVMVNENDLRNGHLAKLCERYRCLSFKIIPELYEFRDINCYRYRFYSLYVENTEDEYDYIMLSDARDVFFQRDISNYPFDPAIDLFFAEEEKLIADCSINAGWIQDLFGPHILEQLKSSTVLCSGTTIGRPAAIKAYLALMIEHIARVDGDFHRRFGYLGGIDQGIHNYIYYQNQLSKYAVKSMQNSENLFYTIGHVAKDDANRRYLNDRAEFITQSGETCYCIHQFDRLDNRILRQSNLRKWQWHD